VTKPSTLDFRLYLITGRSQVAAGHTLLSAAEAALQGGVRALQLRDKELSPAELRPLAYALRELTRTYRAKLLINQHLDLALETDADGVHLSAGSPLLECAREQLGPQKLIGVSTHNLDEIDRAGLFAADFVSFGPVYATPSKMRYGPPQGLSALSEACRHAPLPVFALGGITAARRDDVLAAGAFGIALISAIFAATDPKDAALKFLT
jgi:thiamine-phosphate pyrophosphorylase